MKIAKAWTDDPEGQYEKTITSIMAAFNKGVISGSEAGMARGAAERCRSEALEFNKRQEGGK